MITGLNKKRRLSNTISLKPCYDINDNYLDFHLAQNHQTQSLTRKRQQSLDYINSKPYCQQIHKKVLISNYPTQSKNAIKSAGRIRPTDRSQQDVYTIQMMEGVGGVESIVKKYNEIKQSSNQMMKSIVRQQLFSWLYQHNPIMKRLNKYLAESLLMLGAIQMFDPEQMVSNIEGKLCFVLYGKLKVFNKDVKLLMQEGSLFGQQSLFNCSIDLKAKSLDQTCIFTLPISNYKILREESIKSGLKNQFNELEVAVRLSFIKKKLREVGRHRLI